MASGYTNRKRIVTKANLEKIPKKNFNLWEEFKRDMTLSKGEEAKQTLTTYKSAILGFMIWLSENYDNKDFIEIDHRIVKNYLYYCQEELGNNGKIRNTKTSAISSLLNYCTREEYIDFNPLDKKLQRADTTNERIIEQPFLTEEQIVQLREEIQKIDDRHKRLFYSVLFELGFSTASRVGAWFQFSEDNLDIENRVFLNIREKRGKIVDLSFSYRAQEVLKEWLEYKKELGIETPAIFFSRYGGKYDFMQKGSLQAAVKSMIELVGVEGGHAHTLRKSYANILKKKNVDISVIQEKLLHESSDTTLKFYTKKDTKDNQKKLDKYEI